MIRTYELLIRHSTKDRLNQAGKSHFGESLERKRVFVGPSLGLGKYPHRFFREKEKGNDVCVLQVNETLKTLVEIPDYSGNREEKSADLLV